MSLKNRNFRKRLGVNAQVVAHIGFMRIHIMQSFRIKRGKDTKAGR